MYETKQIPVETKVIRAMFPDAELRGNVPPVLTMVTDDSRAVEIDGVFVGVVGYETDGHLFLAQAEKSGAGLFVVERQHVLDNPQLLDPVKDGGILIVDDTRRAVSILADLFYGHPSFDLRVHGITGTKGKTTTVHILADILREAGLHPGVTGTVGIEIGGEKYKSSLTTPGPVEYQKILRFLKDKNASDVISEVSAHAGGLKRTASVKFETVTFTNLSRDHGDHFPGDAYFEAKRQIARDAVKVNPNVIGVANAGDSRSDAFLEPINPARRVMFAAFEENENPSDVQCDIYAQIITRSPKNLILKIHTADWEREIDFPLIGRFNAQNAVAAAAIAQSVNIDPDTIALGLSHAKPVPGRLEKVDLGQDFLVIVDYAHSPAPVQEILRCLRDLTDGRLIAVMGAGGSRDRGKRPAFGEILASDSDIAVITSDNPRREEPLDIINDILTGVNKVKNPRARIIIEPDRERAIGIALENAAPGDTVVILGKGHENYQIFRDRTIHFDDREVAAEWLLGHGYISK